MENKYRFKQGDLVRVKNTKHVRGWNDGIKAVGFEFEFNITEYFSNHYENWFEGKDTSSSMDVRNTKCINYYYDDLELVNPNNENYEVY
jgi:hypothetical protein